MQQPPSTTPFPDASSRALGESLKEGQPTFKTFSWPSLFLVLPAGILFFFFLFIPLLIVMMYSFAERGPYGGVDFSHFSFQNYVRVFQWIYLKIFWNSFLLAFFVTMICFLMGYPMAYLLVTTSRRWRSFLLILIVIPFWTSFVVRVFAMKVFLGEGGPLNSILLYFGFIREPLLLLNTPFAIGLGMVTNFLPFMVLPLYVVLEKFDFSWVEAARDLGASSWKVTFRILLPLTQSGILAGSLFVFTPALGEFLIPDLLGGAKMMFVGNLITEQFLKTRDWPFGSALTLLLMGMVWISLWIYLRSQKASEGEMKVPFSNH